MTRYFKNNESYLNWIARYKDKLNILDVITRDITIKGSKVKETRIVVKYTIRVREDKNMEFIKIYMKLDNKTKALVDKLHRLRYKDRKVLLKTIKSNMIALKIKDTEIDKFIQDIRVTLDM